MLIVKILLMIKNKNCWIPDERIAKKSDTIDQECDDEDVDRSDFLNNRVRYVEERNANYASQCDRHTCESNESVLIFTLMSPTGGVVL